MKLKTICRKVGRALPKIKELAAKLAASFNPLFLAHALAFLLLAILFAGRLAS